MGLLYGVLMNTTRYMHFQKLIFLNILRKNPRSASYNVPIDIFKDINPYLLQGLIPGSRLES